MYKKRFAVITVSDTCSSGDSIDKSGPELVSLICKDYPESEIITRVIPDDQDEIMKILIHFSDVDIVNLIITTGGTGFAKRDVTPEATRKVVHKLADGISTAMCIESLKITPMAMVSRAVSGIRNNTLIINFPGSPKAAKECYSMIKSIIPHSIDLLQNDTSNIKSAHQKLSGCCRNDHKNSAKPGKGRERKSPYPMIEVNKATDLIITTFEKHYIRKRKTIAYSDSLGFVTADDVLALDPFPPFDASIKDGYACLYEDGDGERYVCYNISAGDNPTGELKRGECAIINTGAPIPPGANCVVQVEDTALVRGLEDKEEIIKVMVKPEKDQDIRKIGSDIKQNTKVIPKGRIIQPADIGLFATVGKMEISVFDKPTIGILSTGNELSQPFKANLDKGHIRDSNKPMLLSFISKYGFPVKDFGIVCDDPITIKNVVHRIFQEVDILITTGSVSMGDKDFMKPVLQDEFDAEILFGRVNMKPGKPTTFATCSFNGTQKYIFALPGNPVSALVTSQIFVVPALMYVMGIDEYTFTKVNVVIDEDVDLDPRPHFGRAVMNYSFDGFPHATLTGNQISSRLMSSSGADILLNLPGSTSTRNLLPKGSILSAILLN